MLLVNQLVGFGAGGGVTTLTQVASATSTAETITGPAGIQSGDLLVLWDFAGNNLTSPIPTATTPSGFTVVTNDTLVVSGSFGSRIISSIKIATGAEASASLTGMTGDNIRKALYVFRGDIAITSVSALDAMSEYTDGDPASQTVNASGGTPPLVVIGCYRASGAIDPRTFSPAKDGEINPTTTLYLAYKIYNSSPQDVTVDMDLEVFGNGLASFYVQCS